MDEIAGSVRGAPEQRPEGTYRLQFHAGFTFRDAAALTGYLKALGITHVYASPYFQAVAGSTHGYDVVDHNALNRELGSRETFLEWMGTLKTAGMSHILDTVPNHVGVATNDNAWWNDVLRLGRNSAYAGHFDITWVGSPRPELHAKVLLPVLGAPYGEVLEKGELQVVWEGGDYKIRYFGRRFPLKPGSVEQVMAAPGGGGSTAERVLESLNGRAGDPGSFDVLDALLGMQHYRLAYWRLASDEINYRRFFDINDLAALRMEREEVFAAAHRMVFSLIEEGHLAGLRIDHPDGLYDPAQYMRRLQEASPGVYVVVEKILGSEEVLPSDWRVDGTSGYDFLVRVSGLLADPAGEAPLNEVYKGFTGEVRDYEELAYYNKRLVLETSLASELQLLAHEAGWLAQRDRRWRDLSLRIIRAGLREMIACFPVYRSYVDDAGASEVDREHVKTAIRAAQERNPPTVLEAGVWEMLRGLVLQEPRASFGEDERKRQRRFAGRFQQLTAPVMAKGIEDTTFYQYHRLVSLNEVGGDPGGFGTTPEALHSYFAQRATRWPDALSPLSTHDTKRSEDVRSRLQVLSEVPAEWGEQVSRWWELTGALWPSESAGQKIDRNDAYLLYQTILGAWPLGAVLADGEFVKRIQAYMTKALREAKVHSRWTDPNEAYEGAMSGWVEAMLGSRVFMEEFLPFAQRIARAGLVNSMAQTVIRLTAPGVPDLYQGTEVWDFSLVDPDNRRPVDYAMRREMLAALEAGTADVAELLARMEDGRIKMFLNRTMLGIRKDFPGLFTRGSYEPVKVRGEHANRVFAFARRHEGRIALVAVPRLVARLGGGPGGELPVGEVWGDTCVEDIKEWSGGRDVFTGELVGARVAELFAVAPFAVVM